MERSHKRLSQNRSIVSVSTLQELESQEREYHCGPEEEETIRPQYSLFSFLDSSSSGNVGNLLPSQHFFFLSFYYQLAGSWEDYIQDPWDWARRPFPFSNSGSIWILLSSSFFVFSLFFFNFQKSRTEIKKRKNKRRKPNSLIFH